MKQIKTLNWMAPTELGAAKPYFYFSKIHLFRPFNLWGVSLGVCFLLGYRDQAGLGFCLAISVFILDLWWQTRRNLGGVAVIRRVPSRAIAGQSVQVELEIVQMKRGRVRDLVLIDGIQGVQQQKILRLPKDLQRGEAQILRYRLNCDFGTGRFSFNPVTLISTDWFGVFAVSTVIETSGELIVYPELKALPPLRITGSDDLTSFGKEIVSGREASINFFGVRDYQRGDSLRHVAWRLSARRSKLLVKEFETNVGGSLTLFLDLSPSEHCGTSQESSWNIGKQIVFSLLGSQMGQGNRVQFLSDAVYVPFGRGEAHLQQMIGALYDLHPDRQSLGVRGGRRGIDRFVPKGSSLFYVGAVLSENFVRTLEVLLSLRARRVRVECVLIRAASFVSATQRPLLDANLLEIIANSESQLQNAAERLREAGAQVRIVSQGEDTGQAMLERWGK